MLRAGIIGLGRIGSTFDDDPKRKIISSHAGAYTHAKGVKLVAACDMDKKKRDAFRKRWRVNRLYEDLEEMLKKENLDILSVCTWSHTHLLIIKKAAKYNLKAIFCEKPIAKNLKDAEEIIKICKKNNIILMIDHQRRFDKFHQDVRDYIKKGKLGKIQQCTFHYIAGIANTGTHIFDLLGFFFGDAEWVQASYKDKSKPDPDMDGYIKFKSGVTCSLLSYDSKHFLIFEMDILGSKARLKITHSGMDMEYYAVKQSRLFSEYKELERAKSPIKNRKRIFMLNGVKHLVDCAKNKKKPICSGEDGKASLELICAFHYSARNNGKMVKLPLKYKKINIVSK